MKYSKQLSIHFRKRLWSVYINMNPLMRQRFNNHNFERYCKNVLTSDLYKTALRVSKERPRLK